MALTTTLHNVSLNPLLIGPSSAHERMISKACLRGSAEWVCARREGRDTDFRQPPASTPNVSLRSALKPVHQRARRPSASRPFIVPKPVKLKQSDGNCRRKGEPAERGRMQCLSTLYLQRLLAGVASRPAPGMQR